MRYLYLAIFLLTVGWARGQNYLTITWKTDRGIIDTGQMARLPARLAETDRLTLVLKHGHEIEVDQQIIEWVVCAGDTLLLRREIDGQSRLLRLLYQGAVQLYKVVRERGVNQYLLTDGDRWEMTGRGDAARLGRIFQVADCADYKYLKAIEQDQQAVELTRRINECRGARDHHAVFGLVSRRHRLGIVVNNTAKDFSEFDDRYFAVFRGPSRIRTVYERPFYAPRLLVSYQREIFRYLPNLKARLDVGLMRRRFKKETLLLDLGTPMEEQQRIDALYCYPGIQYESNPFRTLKFSCGIGPAFAQPLKTKRRVEVLRNLPWPGPSFQEINNFITTSIGYHFEVGAQLQLYRRVWLELAFRHERLEKRLDLSAAAQNQIYFTEHFTVDALTDATRARRWQVGVYYDF